MKRYSKIRNMLRSATEPKQQKQKEPIITLSSDLEDNEEMLKKHLGTSEDLVYRHFTISFEDGNTLPALLVLVDGLSDQDATRNNIIKPLNTYTLKRRKNHHTFTSIKHQISVFQPVIVESDIKKAVVQILKGSAFLIIDGIKQGMLMDIGGYELRALEEPQTERTVRGAREGFIESVNTNMNLIRRRIPHPSLKFDSVSIGKYSQKKVVIAYMDEIADTKLINRVKKRLQQIKSDSVDSSGFVEQVIEDHPHSMFPTIGNTERPDLAASLIVEGRIVILVDEYPFSLYVPYFFLESIKNIEYYSSRPYFTTLVRFIRLLSFFAAILFPAFYIAVLNFHKVMIPSDMVVPFIQARETVPFPLTMEILLVIFMFE